jgi:hypothetical protein
LRHGCWLVALIVGISVVVLVTVGSFGLIGPFDLAAIVFIVAVVVVGGDRWAATRSRCSADDSER